MKLLVFDNYDSFTYNIVQLLREAGADDDITVVRNDRIALEAVGRFDKIILSPGPGIPSEAGILLPLIREYAPSKSILGVCLGEQAIGETFGASLKNLTDVYHGIASRIRITAPDPLFAGVPTEFDAGRYHSSAATDCRMSFKLRPKTKPDRSWPWHTGATTCAECSFIPNRYSRPTAGK